MLLFVLLFPFIMIANIKSLSENPMNETASIIPGEQTTKIPSLLQTVGNMINVRVGPLHYNFTNMTQNFFTHFVQGTIRSPRNENTFSCDTSPAEEQIRASNNPKDVMTFRENVQKYQDSFDEFKKAIKTIEIYKIYKNNPLLEKRMPILQKCFDRVFSVIRNKLLELDNTSSR